MQWQLVSRALAALVLIMSFASCRSIVGSDTVVLVGANIVSIEDETVLPDRTIVIRADRIDAVGDRSMNIPAGATVIEANGRYVLPGLWDGHLHSSRTDLRTTLRTLVPYGITSVRLMHGSSSHLQEVGSLESAEFPVPSVFLAGPLIAGREIHWDHVVAATPEDARRLVREHREAGYDFVKVYDFLDDAVWSAIIDEAEKLDIPVAGHLPVSLDLFVETGARQQTVEHADQLIYAEIGREGSMTASFDQLDSIVSKLAKTGVAVTPTLAGTKWLMNRGTDEYRARLEREEMAYLDSRLIGWWRSMADREPDEASLARRRHFFELQRELTRRLAESGIPLIAGTDAPNPVQIPGISLHDELEELSRAGLDSWAVLRAATTNPVTLIGGRETVGIEEGAVADLLLVEGNPVDDLSVLRRPSLVVVRGVPFTKDILDAQLDQVERARVRQREAESIE